SVTLTADDQSWSAAGGFNGQVIIGGTIRANGYGDDQRRTADGTGQAGGHVALYGYNAVTLQSGGSILASTEHSDERGGDVTFGIAWGTKSWDAATKTGGIDLQPTSTIDVHGGKSGGTVTVRAPLDGVDDVKVTQIKSTVIGARSVTLEGFLSFTTDQTGTTRTGIYDRRWDGIIDPGGTVAGSGSQVTSWSYTVNDGSGYTSIPTVEIIGGDGNASLSVS
ncbi:hypothetical protein, partial [Rhodoplanes sp. SY1]|uniref:hypothetical protein n=1 Tax=Rhodoplanes sp. SY1 TaxID=3166646 RepID=UPI0038B4A805